MQCAVTDKKYVVGQSFGYDYDDIGNLKTENRNGNVFKYSSNSVNQYTERTVPGRVNISGSADASAKVTIKQASAGYTRPQRYGNYFNSFFNLDNSTNAVTDSFDVYAVKYDGTKDIVAKQTLNVFVPKTPEQFTYDDDGNLLSDGKFTYTWNAENRLISAVETGKQKIEYAYDYTGRRYERKTYSWNGSDWTLASTIKYVYDGNNVVAEYDAANTLLRSYLWGEDISGSLEGAGGVGGLLAVNNYLPVYDGNGNVMSYINATNGTVCAEYQYNPFGRIISKSGTNADSFKMLFSTKYYDKETETFYYLYRDYKPEISRWLSRDPIEEQGSNNLYAFVVNNAVNLRDILGLEKDQVLWIVQNDASIYKTEAEKAVNTLAKLAPKGKSGKLKLVPLILQPGRQMEPPKYGELQRKLGTKMHPYIVHLLEAGVLSDGCWDKVYAMHITENGDPEPELTSNILLYGLNPLGYGNNWKIAMYPTRIGAERVLAREEGVTFPGPITNWVWIATMHEIVHAVGGSHIFERPWFGNYEKLLERYPNSLMRPSGSLDWLAGKYTIEDKTKTEFLEGFELE